LICYLYSTKDFCQKQKKENDNQTMTDNEELIGGWCVCSDDQGFSNNALVYCDGKGCTVACHTGMKEICQIIYFEFYSLACYGIVSIPEGDWYCRRCEAGETQAVRIFVI
jgi:hypothetical protein